jgi:uncharacterized RDD family membrane protein YckC
MTLFEPAPISKRIFAAFFDLILLTVATNLAVIPLTAYVGLKELGDNPVQSIQQGQVPFATLLVFLILILVSTAIMHIYFVWFEVVKGATPGKMLVNLEVLSQDGQPLTKKQAITRELARWYIDGPFILVTLIAMMASPKKLRFGDRLAKTQVIQRRILNPS